MSEQGGKGVVDVHTFVGLIPPADKVTDRGKKTMELKSRGIFFHFLVFRLDRSGDSPISVSE